jgi:hypothetical protein
VRSAIKRECLSISSSLVGSPDSLIPLLSFALLAIADYFLHPFHLRSEDKPKHPPLIGRYTDAFPVDLFRINASPKVILKDYNAQKKAVRTSYDLQVQEDRKVHPKSGPNFEGAHTSLASSCLRLTALPFVFFTIRRPEWSIHATKRTHDEVVRNFRGKNTTVYLIRKGKGLHIPNRHRLDIFLCVFGI